jgi:hypothetical protein
MSLVKEVIVSTSSGGVTISPPVWFDINQNPFGIGVFAQVTGVSCTYTVQHTPDNPYLNGTATVNSDAVWYDHAIMNSLTSNRDSNYTFPVKGSRVTTQAADAGNSVKVIFIQSQGS